MTAVQDHRHHAASDRRRPPNGLAGGVCGSRCPTCGRPALATDLACLWLYPDPSRAGSVVDRRHCQHCQPHHDITLIECGICGDGPLLVGYRSPGAAALPDPVARWLTASGWTLKPTPVCASCAAPGEHRPQHREAP